MALNLQFLRKVISDIKIGRQLINRKGISTSAALLGKRNFRKFDLGNKRGTRIFKRDRNAGLFSDIPIRTEVRPSGFSYGGRFHPIPEMIPEFIVPDLTDCSLKPYVSYRVAEVYQSEFTPDDLFEAVYKGKMEHDFQQGNFDVNGNPKEPSQEERLTPEEAWIQARRAGSDIFSERIPKHWECLDVDLVKIRKNDKVREDALALRKK